MGKFSSPTGANHRAAATRPRISGWLLGSCCWLAAGLAQADGGNWRWLDSQGRQVFSDLPPPASVPEPRILQHPELASDEAIACGIWGRKAARATPLREADRVEFWRDLRVDPKVARRERFRSQGAKTAGLFAQRRPGAKSGY